MNTQGVVLIEYSLSVPSRYYIVFGRPSCPFLILIFGTDLDHIFRLKYSSHTHGIFRIFLEALIVLIIFEYLNCIG